MTKIALLSDIHFGVKQSSEKFLNTQIEFFEKLVIPQIQSKNISHLFFLGDVFDDPLSLDILVKNTVIKLFNKFKRECPNLKIVILTGNHDIYYKTTLETTSLAIFDKFDNIELVKTVKDYKIDNKSFLLVPWLIKDSYNYELFNKSIETTYDYCFGHFEINQFEIIPTVIEEKGLSIDTFKNIKNVYSGHFHIRNKIKNIQYLGCPYELTWNDYGNNKGLTIIDIKTSQEEFVENTISPRHVKIKVSDIVKDKSIVKNMKNNFVKLYWDVSLDGTKKLDLQEKLKKINHLDLKIIDECDNNLEEQTESVELEEDIEGSPIAFLNNYYDEIKHPDHIDLTELKLKTDKLYNDSLRD